MGDLVKGIQNTPIPTILIVAGLLIIVLAFVTKIGGIVEVSPEQKRWAIPIGLFVLAIGLVLNSNTVSPPPSSSLISPPSQSSSENKSQTPNKLDKNIDGCGEQLLSKLGRYEGESVIINSSTRRSGKVVMDINREADASCRLIARVEEFSPLAGKGTLTGQFDPNVGQKVALMGSLSHQTQPKIWDVEMNVQFINKNSIEGQSTWKPKSGVEDTKIYYEEFTATKL